MKPLNLDEVYTFVNQHIDEFHQARLRSLATIHLRALLSRKNPYLFKAKNLIKAQDLADNLLDAHLSSSEEEHFGQFLEKLAIFISERTCDGKKSTRRGLDLEVVNGNVYFLIQIKSGTNWGNSSQQAKLAQDFIVAKNEVEAQLAGQGLQVETVLGICYGKTKTTRHKTGYLKVVGQNFWYLISGDKELYTRLIEPIGYQAQEHNAAFHLEKARLSGALTLQLLTEFSTNNLIDWEKIVRYNSQNLDLPDFPQT